MIEIDRVKEEISEIYEEAGKREVEEEEKLANKRWYFVRRHVLDVFNEIVHKILPREGKVVEWDLGGTGMHLHPFDSEEEIAYRAQIELAQLKIQDIGRLIVFRPLEFEKFDGENWSSEGLEETRKHFYIGFIPRKEDWTLNKICPKCEGLAELEILRPPALDKLGEETKRVILEELVALHEKALLE